MKKTLILAITSLLAISANAANAIKISIDGIGATSIANGTSTGKILAQNQKLKYPTQFAQPENGKIKSISEYAELEVGWKIVLNAIREGDIIIIKGCAEFTSLDGMSEATGAVPKVELNGKPSGIFQPNSSTNTTRFIAYAKLDESCKITLNEGGKPVTRAITVTSE